MSVFVVPEGYKWCKDCEALTPQVKVEDAVFEGEFTCVVCGITHAFDYWNCDNCGWEHDPDNDIGPDPKVKAHTLECLAEDDTICECPEVVIYPWTKIRNYKSWAGRGFDCPNELEWSYEVHCPVCGNEFEVEDGNC